MNAGNTRPRSGGRWAVAVALLACAGGLVAIDGGQAAAAAQAKLVVTPATMLRDQQPVKVDITGLGDVEEVTVAQCLAGATTSNQCNNFAAMTLGVDGGRAGGTVLVEPTFWSFVGEAVAGDSPEGASTAVDPTTDCRVTGCELVAFVAEGDQVIEAAVARAPIGFDPDAPLIAAEATAHPATGLVDGQRVNVRGSGFRPGDGVPAVQCGTTPDDNEICRHLGILPVLEDGTVDFPFTVRTRIVERVFGGAGASTRFVDCRVAASSCRLMVRASRPGQRTVSVPLTFVPDGPLLPPPVLTVSQTVDVADGATVTVTGSGFTSGGVALKLCSIAEPGLCDDEDQSFVPDIHDGAIKGDLVVDATFTSARLGPNTDGAETAATVSCHSPPGCAVVAESIEEAESVAVPISFAPLSEATSRRYVDRIFDEVEVRRDVIYRRTTDYQGNPIDLKIDIYLPVGDTVTKRPAIVWMHGGYFIFGSKEGMSRYGQDAAQRGYVGVSLQYRLRSGLDTGDVAPIGEAAYDAYVDASAGVRWLQDHADELGIDPEAIVAGGYSAGAVTSWNLAWLPGDDTPVAGVADTSLIAAAVPISGLPFVAGQPGEPPILAFHAVDDSTVPIGPARDGCARAAAAGAACDFVEYPSGGHSVSSSRFRDITTRTYRFLAERVLTPRGYFGAVPEVPSAPPERSPLGPRPAPAIPVPGRPSYTG